MKLKAPQTSLILKHLKTKGSISAAEAITAYSCYRLAARIKELRTMGWDIATELRYDSVGTRYARYWLMRGDR